MFSALRLPRATRLWLRRLDRKVREADLRAAAGCCSKWAGARTCVRRPRNSPMRPPLRVAS